MAPTYQATSKGYGKMWDECKLTKPAEAEMVANRILKNKAAYLEIEKRLGIPWIFVGVIHERESNLNMGAHLHNGDSLRAYTHHVPAGRPKVGHGPPFTWVESANDALLMKGFDKLKGTWTVELMLFDEELYNGFGSMNKGVNSSYVWAWTNEQQPGKWVADHVWDPHYMDTQPGCAAMMKALAAKDESARAWVSRRQVGTAVPPGAVTRATKKERTAGTAGAGGTVAAGGSEATTPKPDSAGGQVAYHMLHGTVIVIGIAIAVVAAIVIVKKAKLIKERFAGSVPAPAA